MILNSKNIADYKEIVMNSAKITYFLFAAGAFGGTDAAKTQQPFLLKSN